MEQKESFISYRKLTLLANAPQTINAGGRVFWCIAAQAPFEMSYDANGFFPVEGAGITWAMPDPKERFTKLAFRSDVAQTIEFYHGNFLAFGNQVIPVIKVAKTFARPGASTIGANSNLDFDSVPPGRSYRKSIVVTNLDPAVDLDVYMKDAAGAYQLAAAVFFRQAWYLETSDDIRIRNASASPVNCRIVELFY
jgi:hypothetical protein